MKYVSSQDFYNERYKNYEAFLDEHIQNCAYLFNQDVTTDKNSFYKLSLEKLEKVKKIWLLYSVQCKTNTEQIQFKTKIELLNAQEDVLQVREKIFEIKSDTNYYILTCFDNEEVSNVFYINLVFSFNTNLDEVYIGLYAIGVNQKWFEPIIHQDEFVEINKYKIIIGENGEPEEPEEPTTFVYWGSFGYGEFGDTYFGKGVPREL